MKWPCCMALASALFTLAPSEASAAPSYIQASPAELTRSYGEDVAKRAFSDELTEKRKTLIKGSLALEKKCPAEPQFVLRDIYPYQIAKTDVAWVERYEVACGETLRRASLMVLTDGKVEALPLLPGATIADPNLQVDAANIVTAAALARRTDECNEVVIADTALTERPRVGRPWKERWSVYTCGDVEEVDVLFTPSARGGTDIAATPAIIE